MEERKGNNIVGNILGGQFLSKQRKAGQWIFILYIFFLIIIYITINLAVDKTQLSIRRNQKELKNLKADYTSKSAKLQFISKRDEIEERLKRQGSNIKKPVRPAQVVEIKEQ